MNLENIKEIIRYYMSKMNIFFVTLVIVFLIGGIYSCLKVPMYKSSSTLVLNNTEHKKEQGIQETEIVINNYLFPAYRELLTSDKVVKNVIKEMNLNVKTSTIKDSVDISIIDSGNVFTVYMQAENPKKAQQALSLLIKNFREEVFEIYNVNNVYVVDEATLPTEPCNKNYVLDYVMYFLITCVISFSVITVMYYLEDGVTSEKDIQIDGAKVIGSLNVKRRNNILETKSNIKRLTEQLEKNKVYLVTSNERKVGKSFLINEAVNFCSSFENKVVVLNLTDKKLVEKNPDVKYVNNFEERNNFYTEQKRKEYINMLKENYDYIFIDARTINDESVLDCISLADKIVFVLKYQGSSKSKIEKCITHLKNIYDKEIEVIVNKIK